jgi:hypothetical protein
MLAQNAVFVFNQHALLAVVEKHSPEHVRWILRRNAGEKFRFGGAGGENKDFAPPGGALGFVLAEFICFTAGLGPGLTPAEMERVHFEFAKIDEYRACAEAGPLSACVWTFPALSEKWDAEEKARRASQLGRWDLEDAN